MPLILLSAKQLTTPELIFTCTAMLYWVYLFDPFHRWPEQRNYLKLIKDNKYLSINIAGSTMLILMCKFLAALPLLFILSVLIADRISWHYRKKHFTFIHRGDMVSVQWMDTFLSIGIFIVPLFLAIVSGVFIIKYKYELPGEYLIRIMYPI